MQSWLLLLLNVDEMSIDVQREKKMAGWALQI